MDGEDVMNYDTFSEKLSLWLDNELDPAETADLEMHLADCTGCQQLYEQMRQVDQFFQAAAMEMITPAVGFSQRVDARLAYHRPVKPWQMLLAMGSLALGPLLVLGLVVVSGWAFLDTSLVTSGGLLYQGVISLIDSVDNVRVLVNLITLFVKACLITMQQPIFWSLVLLTIGLSWLWLRVMKALSRREHVVTAELIL
jgi:predicted anti-sigma-YlaC factor YlaD